MKNLRKIGSMLVAVIAFLVLGRGLIVQAGAVDISVYSRYSPYAHGYTEELLTVDPAIMSAIPVIGDVDRMMRVELAQQNMQSYRTATPLFVPYVRLGFENPWDLMRLSSDDYLKEPLFDREWYARNFVPFLNLSGGPNGRMYMNAVSSYYDITYAKNGLSGLGCLGVYRHCQETYQYPQNALTSAQMEQARQERDRLSQALHDKIAARQARWQASQNAQTPTAPSPSQDYDLPVEDCNRPCDSGVEAPPRPTSTEETDLERRELGEDLFRSRSVDDNDNRGRGNACIDPEFPTVK